jgi:hypothetical protein
MDGLLSIESDKDGIIGMDMMGFLLEMPLLSILHFRESLLVMLPEAIVDRMLAQVYQQKSECIYKQAQMIRSGIEKSSGDLLVRMVLEEKAG